MKGTCYRANGGEVAFSNVAANFHQCLSLIVNKLSTWDTNQNLGKDS